MKFDDLIGKQLDYWVAKAIDPASRVAPDLAFDYSTDWAQGGPIIERESILLAPQESGVWRAVHCPSGNSGPEVPCLHDEDGRAIGYAQGPKYAYEHASPLVAAMRCFVAARLGITPASH